MRKDTGTYQAIGKNLRKLREDTGITQNAVDLLQNYTATTLLANSLNL